MLGIDTNVIVRLLTRDDPKESARAHALIEGEDVFVPTTVLLETEWVLRSIYGFAPDRIAIALTSFVGLNRVRLENPTLVAVSLRWMQQGMDFADALHLAAAESCDAFVSFDRDFANIAAKIGTPKVRAP